MNDLLVTIPIKDPTQAKSRLAKLLTPDQRKALFECLYENVLHMFSTLPVTPKLLVVTDSREVADNAKKFGASILFEEEAQGETAAVESAAAWAVDHGFASMLVVPGDMAGLDEEEIHLLLHHPRPENSLILCPATDDDGTNAILSSPPNVLPFRFGGKSFPDYQGRAAANGLDVTVLRLQSLVLDLDTPDDADTFLKSTIPHPAKALLRSWLQQTESN